MFLLILGLITIVTVMLLFAVLPQESKTEYQSILIAAIALGWVLCIVGFIVMQATISNAPPTLNLIPVN